MTAKFEADNAVKAYLRYIEREMDGFGSVLPENEGRSPNRLAITHADEYDFGWVYFYNSAEYIETGNTLSSLAGNAPLIVDRTTCKLYSTGTAHSIEHYVQEYRQGVRCEVWPRSRASKVEAQPTVPADRLRRPLN